MKSENINNISDTVNIQEQKIDDKKGAQSKVEKLHPEPKEKIKAEDNDKPDETQRLQDIPKNEFHFLPDDPVELDEFGTHKRVAQNIAEQIEIGERGATIGLEGTWGSGKSSIVKMLERRWKGNNNIRVFTFDAWEHQGDPLKRAFLEELISYLQCKSSGREQWLHHRPSDCEKRYEECEACDKKPQCRPDEICEIISLRLEHSTIDSKPIISKKGITFAVLTLLMPSGLVFYTQFNHWLLKIFFGLLLCAAPLYLFFMILKYMHQGKDLKEMIAEFIGKNKETTRHTTQRSPEPTSIEFRKYYWEILNLVLRGNERKLVLVVDNIDRVEPETARKIWGTMTTFLESHNKQEREISQRVWLTVPYDPTSIVKLWAENKEDGLSRAFKEKSFRVRYRIAQPLASRWEDYFKKRLCEAFPNQDEDTIHATYHIFRIQGLPGYGRKLPTPREMKLYINRMVALAHQHYPDVSLEEIALYVGSELSKPAMLNNLVGWQPENEKLFIDFVGEDWKRGLAAVHFGVLRKDAAEVLYEPLIREYLGKGDSEGLKSLLENTGAPQCCDRYVRDNAPSLGTAELLKFSAAFGGYTAEDASWHIRQNVRCLAKCIESSPEKDWGIGGLLNKKSADHIIRLIKFKGGISESIRNKVSIKLTEDESGAIKDLDKKMCSWVGGAVKIILSLASRPDFDPTLQLVMPNSETYLKILELVIAEPSGKEVLKFFCPSDSVSEKYLNAYLAKIEQGAIRAIDIDIVSGILQMNCWAPKDLERVALGLETAIKPNLAHDATEYVLRILYERQEEDLFEAKLRRIAEDGRVFELLHKHHGQPSCAAYCLGTIFMYYPAPKFEPNHAAYNGQQKYHELLDNPDENITQNIAKYCIELDWLEDIDKSVQGTDSATSECMAVILRKLVDQDNNNDYLNTDRFISCHSLVKSNLDKEEDDEINPYETRVGQLLKKTDGNLLSALQDRQTNIEFGHAYHIALKDEDLDTKSLANKLCQEIKMCLNRDQWLEQLQNEDWMLDIVIELVNQEYKPNLDNKFVDALIEHARLVLTGKVKVKRLGQSWSKLLDGLSDAERELFRRQLPDVLSDVRKPVLDLVALYRDELRIAIQEADRSVKKRFISQACMDIADRGKADEVKWMIILFRDDKSLIKSGDKTEKEGLRNRLEPFLKQKYAEEHKSESINQEWLSAIEDGGKQLGVKLVLETKEEDTNQKDLENTEEKK